MTKMISMIIVLTLTAGCGTLTKQNKRQSFMMIGVEGKGNL